MFPIRAALLLRMPQRSEEMAGAATDHHQAPDEVRLRPAVRDLRPKLGATP
jgi:hypothetical protein